MGKFVTGADAVIKIDGKTILKSNGISWNIINGEFDDVWSNKYAIRTERYVSRHSPGQDCDVGYARVYRLHEFLWKLRLWK